MRTKPEFLIIGAAKSGSTWLVHALREHPDVFVPEREIHYFSREHSSGSHLSDRYLAHFSAALPTQRRGENSNSYLSDPDCAARIAACLPEVKLIALLRAPVERAYSGYCMHLRVGRATADIESYLDPRSARIPQILQVGLYHRHLSRYLKLFPRTQIHVELFDDVKARPAEVFHRVCKFLEVRTDIAPATLGRRVNARDVPVAPPFLQRLVARSRNGRRLAQRLVRSSFYRRIRPIVARPIRYPALTTDLRRLLQEYYCEDIRNLAGLLGRDLEHWLPKNVQ